MISSWWFLLPMQEVSEGKQMGEEGKTKIENEDEELN